jgi:hypothetical protein
MFPYRLAGWLEPPPVLSYKQPQRILQLIAAAIDCNLVALRTDSGKVLVSMSRRELEQECGLRLATFELGQGVMLAAAAVVPGIVVHDAAAMLSGIGESAVVASASAAGVLVCVVAAVASAVEIVIPAADIAPVAVVSSDIAVLYHQDMKKESAVVAVRGWCILEVCEASAGGVESAGP